MPRTPASGISPGRSTPASATGVTRNVTVELAYRYIDLGDAQSGDLIGYDGTNNFYGSTEFEHLTSQDIKLGLRFNFDGFESFGRSASYYAPPPVYAPAPVYAPPPPRLCARAGLPAAATTQQGLGVRQRFDAKGACVKRFARGNTVNGATVW